MGHGSRHSRQVSDQRQDNNPQDAHTIVPVEVGTGGSLPLSCLFIVGHTDPYGHLMADSRGKSVISRIRRRCRIGICLLLLVVVTSVKDH